MADRSSIPEPEPGAREAAPETPPSTPADRPVPNPAAVALGRLGGLKGGPARARALSARRRREIARKAANARWERARRRQADEEKS